MPETIKLVVPVKFSGGGLSMQTTSSRFGAKGMFVRSLVSPKQGSRLTLAFSLPGSPRPLDATGTVTAPPEQFGRETGFWVQFDELSDDARVFLDVVLRSRGVAGPGRPEHDEKARPEQPVRAEQRRAYARVTARFEVGWKSSREFLQSYSENISRGGIFIVTDTPPPLREIVELQIALPDGHPPVKATAEVVHSVSPAEARRRGIRPGAGLQFLDTTDEFRTRLDACIEALSS
jgi:uncharacterized protein (TIGR02266 family)